MNSKPDKQLPVNVLRTGMWIMTFFVFLSGVVTYTSLREWLGYVFFWIAGCMVVLNLWVGKRAKEYGEKE